jgi:ribosomal protein S8
MGKNLETGYGVAVVSTKNGVSQNKKRRKTLKIKEI